MKHLMVVSLTGASGSVGYLSTLVAAHNDYNSRPRVASRRSLTVQYS